MRSADGSYEVLLSVDECDDFLLMCIWEQMEAEKYEFIDKPEFE